jgi:hypothetical protein
MSDATNPYSRPLSSNSRFENQLWEQYRQNWEINKARGYVVKFALRVICVVEVSWWNDAQGRTVYIAKGTTGTLLHNGVLYYVEWDTIKHPMWDNGGYCGIPQKKGEVLPGYLSQL